MLSTKEILKEYANWTIEKKSSGWIVYQITIMFDQLNLDNGPYKRQMTKLIDLLYIKLLSRVFKRKDDHAYENYPIWVLCPDLPVPKVRKKKLKIEDVKINGGLHYHGIVMIPPNKRDDFDLIYIIKNFNHLYCIRGIASIHIDTVTETPEKFSNYVLKSLQRFRASTDDLFILPKNSSEEGNITEIEREEIDKDIAVSRRESEIRKIINLSKSNKDEYVSAFKPSSTISNIAA